MGKKANQTDILGIKKSQQAEHLRVCQSGTDEEKVAFVKNNCGFASAILTARKSGKKITVNFGV